MMKHIADQLLPQKSTAMGPATPIDKQTVTSNKLLWSVGALAAWILLFAAGLLIETVEYRLVLAPRSVEKQLGPEAMKSIISTAVTSTKSSTDSQPVVSRVAYSCFSFFAALFCFTPINLALLTLTAGLLGGCASNITIDSMSVERRALLNHEHPRRSLFLQEPPISAAIRGFIVFLGVIAGLYVAMDDPFKDPTPGQYIRLAGTLSIMAFIVGYDASRLEEWFRAIPGPNGSRHENQPPIPPEPTPEHGEDSHPLSDNEQHMADKEKAAS